MSAKDAVYRQYLLGGQYAMFNGSEKNSWKNDCDAEKARMIPKFYQYVQETAAGNFAVPWSQWLNDKAKIGLQNEIK